MDLPRGSLCAAAALSRAGKIKPTSSVRVEITTLHQKASAGLKPIPGESEVWDRGTRRPRAVPEELQKSCKCGQPRGLNGGAVQRPSGRL